MPRRSWVWPEVELNFSPWILLFKYWTGRSDLRSSLCLYYVFYVSLVMASDWEIAFFWPIASCHLHWYTEKRLYRKEWAQFINGSQVIHKQWSNSLLDLGLSVDLMFCPWLLFFKLWTHGAELSSLSVPITRISSENQWVRRSFLLSSDQ
jgi:hypothetical protein